MDKVDFSNYTFRHSFEFHLFDDYAYREITSELHTRTGSCLGYAYTLITEEFRKRVRCEEIEDKHVRNSIFHHARERDWKVIEIITVSSLAKEKIYKVFVKRILPVEFYESLVF